MTIERKEYMFPPVHLGWFGVELEMLETRRGDRHFNQWVKYKIERLLGDQLPVRCANGNLVSYVCVQRADNPLEYLPLHPDHVARILAGQEQNARVVGMASAKQRDTPPHLITSPEGLAKFKRDVEAANIRAKAIRLSKPRVRPIGTTKKARAAELYAVLHGQGKSRREIIEAFKDQLDMTEAGAATYYNYYK